MRFLSHTQKNCRLSNSHANRAFIYHTIYVLHENVCSSFFVWVGIYFISFYFFPHRVLMFHNQRERKKSHPNSLMNYVKDKFRSLIFLHLIFINKQATKNLENVDFPLEWIDDRRWDDSYWTQLSWRHNYQKKICLLIL